jgi:hypothetical protein
MQLLCPVLPAKVPAVHAEQVGLLPQSVKETAARNWPLAQFTHSPEVDPPHAV